MMMPLILGDLNSIPLTLQHWKETLGRMFEQCRKHFGSVGYITIDEKEVKAGKTHRRAGLHVDGVYNGSCGGWGGGDDGGGWGAVGNGMFTVSSVAGCRAYNQTFEGKIGKDGECDQFVNQLDQSKSELFGANVLYWVDGLCVHESLPMPQDTKRQFVRLSMPSKAPWFEGYSVNPLGVQPTGAILPKRPYMGD